MLRTRLGRVVGPWRAGQILLCLGWVGLLFVMAALDTTPARDTLTVAVVVGSTIALGLVVGRWWVLAVPLAVFVGLTFYLIFFASYDTASEESFSSDEAILFMYFIATEFLLAMPVAFREVVRRLS